MPASGHSSIESGSIRPILMLGFAPSRQPAMLTREARPAAILRELFRVMTANAASADAKQADFAAQLTLIAERTEALLDRLLSETALEGERMRPPRLIAAMRHAALGGGKRLRPFLVVQTAALFNVPQERALMAGAALECIHCYSLIHDDLPSMDDDDLRRGKPTVHKAFDEATAILAGDSLLTLAFDIASRPETHPDAAVGVALVSTLARAAGIGGMAGGQMLDLAAEGRFGARETQTPERVAMLQSMKTGALIEAACRMGGLLGGCAPDAAAQLARYGSILGEAFQIADDLLDAEGDTATLGKRAGKDAAAGKATQVSILGIAGARQRLTALVDEAGRIMEPFGARGDILRATAQFVAQRKI
jgi:farnesyl diphosphate synthase